MKQKLFAILLSTLISTAYAREELTVIQTVSKDRKSFVVGKGIKDGILKNQEIIFANDNVSMVCKAIEVNRNYSLWVPVERDLLVPFKKEDIVSSNSVVYGNVGLEIASSPDLIPKSSINEQYRRFRLENHYSLKFGYNKALSQSASSVAQDQSTSGLGYSVSAEFNHRFMPEFEMNYGVRIDNDVYRVDAQNLDIPITRTMATVGATYHFVNFSESKRNFYLTLAVGLGQSKTEVSGETSSGIVKLLPEVRVGYLMPFSQGMAMVFEGSVDSLSSTEEFPDGTEQTTNIVNLKATIGLRF